PADVAGGLVLEADALVGDLQLLAAVQEGAGGAGDADGQGQLLGGDVPLGPRQGGGGGGPAVLALAAALDVDAEGVLVEDAVGHVAAVVGEDQAARDGVERVGVGDGDAGGGD